MADEFLSVRHSGAAELIIKRSRFIGQCFPVTVITEAEERLAAVRRVHRDASHHCYAFRIGNDGRQSRSSDDGEPSGTAGAPILGVLTRQGIVNALCVVTRYYGGVKLGAGGLVRAYAEVCAAAVEKAEPVIVRSCTAYEIIVPYPMFQVVENVAALFGGLEEKTFTDAVRALIWIWDDEADDFLLRLRNATEARCAPRAVARESRPYLS